MTLIERIIDAYNSDEINPEFSSECLVYYYKYGNRDERDAIDFILIAICGWSMKTLMDFDNQGGENDAR